MHTHANCNHFDKFTSVCSVHDHTRQRACQTVCRFHRIATVHWHVHATIEDERGHTENDHLEDELLLKGDAPEKDAERKCANPVKK